MLEDILVGTFFLYLFFGVLFFPLLVEAKPDGSFRRRDILKVLLGWPYLAMKIAYTKDNETK